MVVPDLESDLGVPFPGRILPPDRWTPALHLDDGKPFKWNLVFGRHAPRIVDLGCGTGRFLVGSALRRPDHDHLGIDVVDRLISEAADRAGRRGLANVRFAAGDAVPWLFERLSANSVDEIHIYHPQPYFNAREKGQRILTPEFLDRLWRVLRQDGLLVLQTDHASTWRYLLQAASPFFQVEIVRGAWPEEPEGRTRREIVSRRKGMVIRRMTARRRDAPLATPVPQIELSGRRSKRKKGAAGQA